MHRRNPASELVIQHEKAAAVLEPDGNDLSLASAQAYHDGDQKRGGHVLDLQPLIFLRPGTSNPCWPPRLPLRPDSRRRQNEP